MRNRKVKTYQGRLMENNMFHRVGEKVRIKSKDELRESGMSERSVRHMKHLCNRVFLIIGINTDKQFYILEGSNIPVVDADIDHMVL